MIKFFPRLFFLFLYISIYGQSSKTVIYDRFDMASDWPTLTRDYGSVDNWYGFLHLTNKRDNWGLETCKNVSLNMSKNFLIETKVEKRSGDEYSYYGLIFGRRNKEVQYEFTISKSGFYKVIKAADKKRIVLTRGKLNYNFYSSLNVLRVMKIGNSLVFKINNEIVFTYKNPIFKGAELGFVTYNKSKVSFQYLDIKYLSSDEINKVLNTEQLKIDKRTNILVSNKTWEATMRFLRDNLKYLDVVYNGTTQRYSITNNEFKREFSGKWNGTITLNLKYLEKAYLEFKKGAIWLISKDDKVFYDVVTDKEKNKKSAKSTVIEIPKDREDLSRKVENALNHLAYLNKNGKNNFKFKAKLSKEKIKIGEPFKIVFSINQRNSENFTPPDLTGFKRISGPSQSVNQTWMNGRVVFEQTYTYQLKPLTSGKQIIGKASIEVNGEIHKTAEVSLVVDSERYKEKNPSNYNIHLEAHVSNSSPKASETISVEFRLYIDLKTSLNGYEIIKTPSFKGFNAKNVSLNGFQIKNGNYKGKPYRYIVVKQTQLTPRTSGTYVISGLSLDIKALVPTGRKDFFGLPMSQTVNIDISSTPLTLNVQ